ncbi:alpha-1,2-Mannosidase [Dirofilaria immitis]|nr:alpha-1,2-Mannosidase [Dirofilaria immitis]
MRKLYRSGSEGHLPFLVNPISERRKSLRMCRYWRSLARLQRSIMLILFVFLFIICFIVAKNAIDMDDIYQLPGNIANKVEPINVPANNHKLPEEVSDKELAMVNENNGKSENNKEKRPQNDKQIAVVNAFKHAWEGYKKYAWGHDHLKPVTKSYNDWFGLGLTIVDSLSTAIIMGLDDEFEEGRKWVAESLSFEKNRFVSFFETTIRVLGGLLSAYHLSGDEMFVHRAQDLGSRLAGAYAAPSAIPYSDMLAFRTSEHVHNEGCQEYDGLCGMFISPVENDYNQSIAALEKHLLRYTKPNNFAFVGEIIGENVYSPKMDHLACFIAGTLALGSMNGLQAKHLELAKDIGKGCRKMYDTKTGLGPEIVYFNVDSSDAQDISIKYLDAHSLLRPEAIEAWFYLYRATGDKIYQQWGWEAFKAIETYAKLEYGYSSVNNVKRIPVTHSDKPPAPPAPGAAAPAAAPAAGAAKSGEEKKGEEKKGGEGEKKSKKSEAEKKEGEGAEGRRRLMKRRRVKVKKEEEKKEGEGDKKDKKSEEKKEEKKEGEEEKKEGSKKEGSKKEGSKKEGSKKEGSKKEGREEKFEKGKFEEGRIKKEEGEGEKKEEEKKDEEKKDEEEKKEE